MRAIEVYAKSLGLGTDLTLKDSPKFVGLTVPIELANFNIKLSDSSLSKLIKHQKEFKREGSFSRTEYEKFLLQSNITASNFESNLSKLEKKKQLLDFIGGGLVPSEFLVNILFDRINQKRNIELIDLNVVFDKKINFLINC